MPVTESIANTLMRLTAIDSPTGFTDRAAAFVAEELQTMGYAPERTVKGGVLCRLGEPDEGGSAEGCLLLAHLDTLGGMVQTIQENGRLHLTRIGGLMASNVETENVRIYTYDGRVYTGTFQLKNASAHVNSDYAKTERNFDTMEVVLDEPVSSRKETAALGIETGNYVCFDPRTVVTPSGYIKSRFLDDKLSVAILLELARQARQEKLVWDRPVWMHITVFEEVGHGAAATVPDGVTELLSVDMGCVGEGLSCDERKVSICVKDSGGPYNYAVTRRLIELAREQSIPYAADVYPFYGSDADCALSAGHDCKHALIGAGVYASHGYERSHVEGAQATLDLLRAYLTR